MDFASLSPEKREEWRRQEITSMALAFLREMENAAMVGTIASAESDETLADVRLCAGYRKGLAKAIDLLTREK